jgi:5-methylcytosine-specific restriction protein A
MPNRLPTLNTRPHRQQSADRPTTAERGYDAAWKRARLLKLAASPLCEDCADRGLVEAATEVDHIRAIAAGGTHDLTNLRSLCKSCHSRKTVRCDGVLEAVMNLGRAAPGPVP